MKFSEITPDKWDELKPFLDTALLPVTGLDGSESPHAAAEQLERLRDLLDLLERPFRGRTVTYPAFHFIHDKQATGAQLAQVAGNLKQAGFRHVVIVTLVEELADDLTSMGESIDLVITPNESEQVQERIASMWQS